MYIWDDEEEIYRPEGFTHGGEHYYWDEEDRVFYNDNDEDDYYTEVPPHSYVD